MKALLEYKFILEPNAQHNSLDSFEQSLAQALRSIGYEPELVQNNDEKCKMVILNPLDMEKTSEPSEKTPSQILNNMSKSRDFNGKFNKNG